MGKVLDCGLEVSEFEIQSHYYVHFQTYNRIQNFPSLRLIVIPWLKSPACFTIYSLLGN